MVWDRGAKTIKYADTFGSEYVKMENSEYFRDLLSYIEFKCFVDFMLKNKVQCSYFRLKTARDLNFGYFAGPSSPFK